MSKATMRRSDFPSDISDATGARNKIAGKISPATQVISVPIQEISQMIGEFLLPTSVISQIPQIIFEMTSEFSKVVWGFSEITRENSENSRIIFGFSSTFFVLATDISHFPSTTCAFFYGACVKNSFFPATSALLKPSRSPKWIGRALEKHKLGPTGQKGRKNMADYIPTTDGDLKGWLTNLKTKTTTRVTELEITPARLTKITGWCDALLGAMQTAEDKKSDWLAASKDKQTQEDTSLAGLRGEINKWKAADGMTDAIATELRVVGVSSAFDADGYKPQITADAFSGYVRIKFKKAGADGINLYSRFKGTTGWKFVSRDTNSPYDDYTPLVTAGQPEVREYQAFGLLSDEQIGQPSDIVTVTFAG